MLYMRCACQGVSYTHDPGDPGFGIMRSRRGITVQRAHFTGSYGIKYKKRVWDQAPDHPSKKIARTLAIAMIWSLYLWSWGFGIMRRRRDIILCEPFMPDHTDRCQLWSVGSCAAGSGSSLWKKQLEPCGILHIHKMEVRWGHLCIWVRTNQCSHMINRTGPRPHYIIGSAVRIETQNTTEYDLIRSMKEMLFEMKVIGYDKTFLMKAMHKVKKKRNWKPRMPTLLYYVNRILYASTPNALAV